MLTRKNLLSINERIKSDFTIPPEDEECMRFLKKQLPIKCDPSLLKRISYTETQTGKTRLQRRLNVRNSFAVSRPIQKENIILFDEVVTTGATVNEASRQLKRAGARHVVVWCIARTVR